ncbi:MAG TPA: alpha-galactosidase [Clostridia bacterium]|jgi:alpha-galactosidase|nr:alpha-galactosidase [Clostridia bacterium]HQA98066.1 alpha-galactosidase [Clostridia bacterium]HQO56429.1 alpha-galactosidase [Clostridia bacterium]HUM60332.1 alpha-galactosidase [Clostridia bacterium]
MSRRIAFIGAGSFGFTRSLVRDLLSFPAFADATIVLMDIDADRLSTITRAVKRIVEAGNYPAQVIATQDRTEALKGAHGVVTTILAGDVDVWQHDILIPKKYGVDINVGDTRGPSGIFRFLRTVNPIMEIAQDISRYCPEAVYLNYTNPMAMLCRVVQEKYPKLVSSGLCHSVQGTAAMLARWIGLPEDEISYTCAGINHQAFYLDFLHRGKDVYPLIDRAIRENTDVYNEEIVRNELYLAMGYYVTESSGHNSEYVSWFRKRPDLIEKYCTHGTGWNPGHYAYILNEYKNKKHTWKQEIEEWFNQPVDLNRGGEYAASIFNAVFGDQTLYKFNGNVRNFNLIDNLPYGCCVEVPVLASKHGLEAIHVGKLPPQLALMCNTSAQIEEMAVEASLTGNRELVYQAICYDPLTAAVLSLKEIKAMTDEMFAQFEEWLPQFQ